MEPAARHRRSSRPGRTLTPRRNWLESAPAMANMAVMKPSPLPFRAALGAAALFTLAGCNEDQSAEVKSLTEELELARDDYASLEQSIERNEERLDKAQDQISELKAKLREAERNFRDADRELQRYKRIEEAALKAEAEKPDEKELRAAARKKVGDFQERVVTIAGDKGNGIGLLVKSGDKNWIYCGREVIEANTKLEIATKGSGALKRFGAFEVAARGGLARLEVLDEGVEGIEPQAGDAEIERNTALLAFDAKGELIDGRCYGEEANGTLQIDSRIAACPAGTTVFHGDTGMPLGLLVARPPETPTLWPDPHADERRSHELVRLDAGGEWSAVPIGTFLKEARMLDAADDLSRLVHAFAATDTGPQGLTYGGLPGFIQTEELLTQHNTNPAVRSLRDLDAWLKENAERSSVADVNKKIRSVYAQIETMHRRQSEELGSARFSPANSARAERSIEWQKEAGKDLARRLSALD